VYDFGVVAVWVKLLENPNLSEWTKRASIVLFNLCLSYYNVYFPRTLFVFVYLYHDSYSSFHC
jgi:hypothetical protein